MKKPTFGICAPSSYANRDKFDAGLEKLRALGHELIVHPQAYGRLGDTQLAGTVPEKIAALYDLNADPRVDLILTACGGNTAGHLLDQLDYTRLIKPMIGYSDTSALSNAAYTKTGRGQYHGPGVTWFQPDRFRQDLYEQMMDVITSVATDIPLSSAVTHKPGHGTGKMIGGNLAVFQHLLHTPWCPNLDGAILFFEDIGDELSAIDRTMNYFRLLGLFDRAAGVIFGQFADMKDTGRPFGFTVDDIIANHTASAKCPIITNAPFGHTGLLVTFPLGATATLAAQAGTPPRLTLVK